MRLRTSPFLLPLLAAACGVFAGVAVAGTGFGDSPAAVIDTAPPAVTVADPPPNLLLQTGDPVSLDFTIADDYPGSDPGDNFTTVRFGALVWETGPDLPGSGSFTWDWTAPDTSSASVHLVVTATDAFGNRTVVQSADFSILSGATPVPGAGPGQVFAAPVPNPFNPRTELRFDLPLAGPVRVTVHDLRGHRVRTLWDASRPAGPLVLAWDGRDDAGRPVAGGAYLVRLGWRDGGGARAGTRKVMLLP